MQLDTITNVYFSKEAFIRGVIIYFLHNHNYEHLFEFINDNILLKGKNLYLAHMHG